MKEEIKNKEIEIEYMDMTPWVIIGGIVLIFIVVIREFSNIQAGITFLGGLSSLLYIISFIFTKRW